MSLGNIQKRPPKSIEDNILPMINIVFLLLVFFMVSGQIKESDPIPLSPAFSKSEQPNESKTKVIFVNQGGKIFLDDRPFSKDQFLAYVSTLPSRETQQIWQLKVDQNYPASNLLALFKVLANAGFRDVDLITLEQP